jgi:hypothetical protein
MDQTLILNDDLNFKGTMNNHASSSNNPTKNFESNVLTFCFKEPNLYECCDSYLKKKIPCRCPINIALQNKIHLKTSLSIPFPYNLKIIIFLTSKNIQKIMHDVVHHKTIKHNNMDFTLEAF